MREIPVFFRPFFYSSFKHFKNRLSTDLNSHTGILDVEILENYIVNHLGGVIGEAYAEADCRIAFTEGEVMPHSDDSALDAETYVIWIAAVVVVLVVLYRKMQHKD